MGTPYRHKSLSGHASLRLFHLEPGKPGDALKGEISIANLESHPGYEAVSYVWGAKAGNRTIDIKTASGERSLEITQGLDHALRRFRRSDATRILWVDSVCINQASTNEKNQQVPLMGAIYRQADKVLIWLGEDADPNRPALVDDCMWKLHNAIDAIYALEAEKAHGLPHEFYGLLNVRQQEPDDLHLSLGIPRINFPKFQAFQDLLRNPWFVRAWTWQESHVAKDRLFHRGDQTWGREPIVKAVIAIFVLRNVTGLMERYAYENKFAMDMLGNESFWFEQTEYLEFRRILQSRRGSGCKYASDLIYSLLGGAKRCPPMEVDYNRSFETVFARCAWQLILQYQDFGILRDLERDKQSSDLPSWVPDWRVRAPSRSDILGVSTALRYRATGSSRPIIELSSDSRVLTANGITFGVITNIEPAEADNLEFRIATIFGGKKAMVESYEPTQEILLHAMQRTWFVDSMDWADDQGYLQRWTADAMEQYDAIWDNKQADEESALRFGWLMRALTSRLARRSVFVTSSGHIGIVANTIQPGDVIALPMGADMPFVLRPLAKNNHYALVADCYLHGYMDGEALTHARKEIDPDWNPDDTSWLERLHEEDLPFAKQQFHIH